MTRSAIACVLGLAAAGCGGAPPPEKPPAPPPPPLQFVEPDAPFIVDWDPAQIASLTAVIRSPTSGAVVVAYRRSVIGILPDCHLSGAYVPSGIGMYRGLLQVRRSDSLGNTAGVRADALQQISTSSSVPGGALFDYRFVVVGRHHLGQSRTSARMADLAEPKAGGCAGATHFVRAALTGAFERVGNAQGTAALPGGRPGAGPPAPGPMLARAGDFPACLLAGTAASPACQAFLKIELTPLQP